MKTSYLVTAQAQKARRLPLLNLGFKALIQLPNESLELEGKQISDIELRLEANPTQVHLLVPREALIRPGVSLAYPSEITINNLTLKTKVQVLRCRRSSQTKFEVALKLVNLDLETKQELEQILNANLSQSKLANPFN